jgi:hypothetical protein
MQGLRPWHAGSTAEERRSAPTRIEVHMKASIMVGGLALGLSLAARPAPAQMVQAGVVFQSGPIAGHVVVGEPGPVVVYPAPVRHVVVIDRYTPRVIVVEPVGWPRGRAYGWRRYGYRPVVVYYDGARYYDRWFGGRPGLRRVEVYRRDGRYYRRDRYRGRDWDD